MQHLFYNLSNQGAEKEPCGREQLQKEELKFSCMVRSMCVMPYCLVYVSSEDVCVCHLVLIYLPVIW